MQVGNGRTGGRFDDRDDDDDGHDGASADGYRWHDRSDSHGHQYDGLDHRGHDHAGHNHDDDRAAAGEDAGEDHDESSGYRVETSSNAGSNAGPGFITGTRAHSGTCRRGASGETAGTSPGEDAHGDQSSEDAHRRSRWSDARAGR